MPRQVRRPNRPVLNLDLRKSRRTASQRWISQLRKLVAGKWEYCERRDRKYDIYQHETEGRVVVLPPAAPGSDRLVHWLSPDDEIGDLLGRLKPGRVSNSPAMSAEERRSEALRSVLS